jgi:hypothetical protein
LIAPPCPAPPVLWHLFALIDGERFGLPNSLDRQTFRVERSGVGGDDAPPFVFRDESGASVSATMLFYRNGGSFSVQTVPAERGRGVVP